jgi:transaldolase
MANERLKKMRELGQSPWVDGLSRGDTREGRLQELLDQGIVGVTSNPAIFQKAIAGSDLYDEQLAELSRQTDDPKEIFLHIAKTDIQEACDVLMPVYRETNLLDGYVSLEVSPDLAYDTQGTVDEAVRLHEMVDRPNLLVKIPATEAGLEAIEEMTARGKSINVTLIFSLERYRKVAESYLRGLKRLVDRGEDPSPVASVASFFVSRVDTEADKRLDELGREDLKGKLGIANAKLAYQEYKEIFSGPEWEALAEKGATAQRCLWASTSTKNPEYRDVMYVEGLVGPQTVNTMPESTIEAVEDHAEIRPTLEEGVQEARQLFEELEEAGVDYDDVVETLEREGIQKFVDPFEELKEEIKSKGNQLVS